MIDQLIVRALLLLSGMALLILPGVRRQSVVCGSILSGNTCHPGYHLPVGPRPSKRRFFLRQTLSQVIQIRLIRSQLISKDAVALQDAA